MTWKSLEVTELLKHALVGKEGSVIESTKSAHGKSAVLQLRQVIPLELFRILAQPQRVEAEVAWSAFTLECPDEGKGAEYLEEGHKEKDLGHATSLNEEVVCFNWVQSLSPREQEEFGHDVSENREHGNAAC